LRLDELGINPNEGFKVFIPEGVELAYTRDAGIAWIRISLPADGQRDLEIYANGPPGGGSVGPFERFHLLVFHFDGSPLSTNGFIADSNVRIFTPGVFNSGVFFNANQSTMMTVSESSILNLVDAEFTLEAWITISEAPTGDAAIVSRGIEGTDLQSMSLVMNANRQIIAKAGDRDQIRTLISGESLSLNVPHHVAVSSDGNAVVLYVDGVQVAAELMNGGSLENDNAPLYIGGQSLDDGQTFVNFFNGSIDEVRLSTIAVSESHAAATFRNGYNQLITIGATETR